MKRMRDASIIATTTRFPSGILTLSRHSSPINLESPPPIGDTAGPFVVVVFVMQASKSPLSLLWGDL